MVVDKFRIHFLYLPKLKRVSLVFVYLAFFDDGTTFPYLPVLPRNFLFGADTLSGFVKEHAAAAVTAAYQTPSTVEIMCRAAKKKGEGLKDFYFHPLRTPTQAICCPAVQSRKK